MSLAHVNPNSIGRAEYQFRNAFERLKKNTPQLLPKGSKVTQNNVAREAGVDPSALRRSRFPVLVLEIQEWINKHSLSNTEKSQHQIVLANRVLNRDLRGKLAEYKAKGDLAVAKLIMAEACIIELMEENKRLQALLPQSQVHHLRPADFKKHVEK